MGHSKQQLSRSNHKQQHRQEQVGFSSWLKAQYYQLTSQLQTADTRAIAAIVSGAVYFAVTHSTTVYLFLTCFLLAAVVKHIADLFPGIGIRVKPWHLLGLALTLTAVLAWEAPASAQFFDSLEEGVTDVITEGDTGIDEGIVETIFTFFRIIIVLAFLVGVAAVLTQAFRGNDWSPIANMLGVGVAFVIVIELITQLILGEA